MSITTLGIDLAKNVFHVHGRDAAGRPVLQKQFSRAALVKFMAILPSCRVGLEVCGGANYWSRTLQALGHEVRLISPQFVKPYVKSNKNDFNDAEAICEAVLRPTMRLVTPKTVAQQDLQNLHRVRRRLIRGRTALVNQIRGLLAEYGVVVPKQVSPLRRALPRLIEDLSNDLTPLARMTFTSLHEELRGLDARITAVDHELKRQCACDERCQRLTAIEEIGPLTATASIAAVADPRAFKNGRHLAAWLGLVPRQCSSGGKSRLLGISKRGDRYVRTLLIHGARAVVVRAGAKSDARSRWIADKRHQRGTNRACVAVANKNARIIWALFSARHLLSKSGLTTKRVILPATAQGDTC